MDEQIFSFDLVDKDTPDVVIGESLKQIEEKTRGYVLGHIHEYKGPISSYVKKTKFAAALENMPEIKTIPVDIQDDLGEQDEEDNRFEVFVSVRNLEHYKYRMMFVDYGTISYPVTIVMNEDLAREYNRRSNERFSVGSVRELQNMMDIVLNSKVMFRLPQNLIYESMRQENNKNA